MKRRYWKLGALAVTCIAMGAGASLIASAGASTSTARRPARALAAGPRPALGARALLSHRLGGRALLAHRLGALAMFGGRAVEGEIVLATGAGKFTTVTFARGSVSSVSGQQLTIAEGTQRARYRTVTLTIPRTARVRVNRRLATLANVAAGQRVVVIQAPQRTWVIARA